MKVRRVITGHDRNGKAIFADDRAVPRAKSYEHTPGFASAIVWATPARPAVPYDGTDPTPRLETLLPEPGGTRFLIVTFPPDSVMMESSFDPAAAGREHVEMNPGLAEKFELDNPGMHTTDTVDYGIVLQGEIWLELDDGRVTHLKQHDVVVQNGTRHAWRNKGNAPATLAFILIGAARS